jgi:hypothetical protein
LGRRQQQRGVLDPLDGGSGGSRPWRCRCKAYHRHTAAGRRTRGRRVTSAGVCGLASTSR